jgi:hypothetical protein
MIWRFETNEFDREQEEWEECPIPHGDEGFDYRGDEWEWLTEQEFEDRDEGSNCVIEIDPSQEEIKGPF